MATLDVSNQSLAAAPVIVTSPTTRCGTTLVQRLLCASDNAFIYGEEIGSQFRALTSLFAHQIRNTDHNGQAIDRAFNLALAGGLRDWRPGLTPPAQVMVDAWTRVYYQLPLSLAAFGETTGRPIWGFKWPGLVAGDIRSFLTLMPRSTVVYVLRNALDALRSAKARRFVTSAEAASAFCAEWASNVEGLSAFAEDPRVLVLKYEDLMADREGQLEALCAFTGARRVRRSEFDLKVNTFQGEEADGHSPAQYIAPTPLTQADWAALRAQAGEQMARYYPSIAAA